MQPLLNRPSRVLRIAAATFPLVAFAASARADIFQWEYINPADPNQGKQQSATLAPDGAGVDAVPGANLFGRNLTMAYLDGADVSGSTLTGTNLRNASLRGANLQSSYFSLWHTSLCALGYGGCIPSDLTSADVSQADLRNANFEYALLTNANLSQANLRNASFRATWLNDTDFTGAQVQGSTFYGGVFLLQAGADLLVGGGINLAQLYSTASYQAHDLSGVALLEHSLYGANFAGQNLTAANFQAASLNGANFAGANIQSASFKIMTLGNACCIRGSGITPAQLYPTASYQAHNLSGVNFTGNNLAGANFTNQKLTHVNFTGANLTDADFTDADIRGAAFDRSYHDGVSGHAGTGLTVAQLYSTASFQEHDLRGVSGLDLANAITTNLIFPSGHIDGLNLFASDMLIVRNYGAFPFLIKVDQHLGMGPGGVLRMVFATDEWNSTIWFDPGIPVTLGGTLELIFADNVNLASQLGRTFDLFDWTGVNPTGVFAVSSPYTWDLSNLYITGEVTLTAVPESASIALTAASAFGLTFYRRRNIP